MRFSTFQNLHELVALTPSKLDAMNGATKEDRIDILMRLIRDNKPLELAKGGTFTVTNIEPALANCLKFKKNPDSFGRAEFPLEGEDKTIMSNQLGKSKVFGGDIGGAGSGTADTARNEAHNACMMYAMVHHGHNNDLEYFDTGVIAQAYKDNGKSNVDINTDKIL